MTKPLLIGFGVAGTCLGIGLTVWLQFYRPTLTAAGLDARCQHAAVHESMRTVVLRGKVHMDSQHGELHHDCRLELQNKASLEIQNSDLKTHRLVISSTSTSGAPNELRINHTRLSSQNGGLVIRLQTKGSQIFLSDSYFEYPLSIVVSVGPDEDNSESLLIARHNNFKSVGSQSRGIGLLSTGEGQYFDNQFQLTKPDDFAYVVAVNCKSARNRNSSPRCQLN